MMLRPGRSLVAGAILAALLSSISLAVVTRIWEQPLHVPFQYTRVPYDDEQDATLDMMLIKNIHETGWFNTNPALNAPFEQHWAEWPMGGDLLAYTVKKALVDTTGDVPLTFNLFWLLTFPFAALIAFPVLRSLRCSWATALVGAVLFSLAPYHFRNGAAHENLAFYVGIPVIVLLCAKVLAPDGTLPSVSELRHRAAWWRIRWLLLGAVLVGVTGIYYLAFLLSLLGICAGVSALARRRPGRLVLAMIFGAVGLAASFAANLPTLLYRWQHAPNLLGVPDRQIGVSEAYPLRLVELLSPVTQHRFGPLAALADRLYEPGREGLGTAQLGLAAAIGLVCAITTVLVRSVRRGDRGGWAFEARLGIIVVAALLLATKGGLSRPLELVGLQGVRAWNRIAIVIAFACIVVLARLLDRLRVAIHRRRWQRPKLVFTSVLALVLVVGVLDQASPAQMPDSKARAGLWHSDGAFVAALERRLPKTAMVFQLPVVDFPEHSAVEHLSGNDLIKEGYLHSKSLRWSAGGVRGRDGEWQFPAAALPIRDLVRGISAIGFTGLTLDRYGYPHSGKAEVGYLDALLGPPVVDDGHRLLAWDLRGAAASLLRGMNAAARRALAQQMFDAPRVYYETDAVPIRSRAGRDEICASGTVMLVNPGHQSVRRDLSVKFNKRNSTARHGSVTIAGKRSEISADDKAHLFPVDVAPGTSTIKLNVRTPGVRCQSTPLDTLPRITIDLRTVIPGG
jgi:phosphoglycerol transferase